MIRVSTIALVLFALALTAGTAIAETPVKTPQKPGATAAPLPPDLDDLMAEHATRTAADDPIYVTLSRPEVQAQVVALSIAQMRTQPESAAALRTALAQLLANPEARLGLSMRLRDSFDSFGFTTPSDDQIQRVAATIVPGWAFDGLNTGLWRLPTADVRALLETELTIADSLIASRCDSLLSPWSLAEERATIRLSAITALPPDQAAAALQRAAAANLLAYGAGDDPAPLGPAEEDRGRAAMGAAIMAAIDADPDPDRLLRGLLPVWEATDQDRCDAQRVVLRAVLGMTGEDGDLALRLVATYGLTGS